MSRKIIAMISEILPLISAVLFFLLIFSSHDSALSGVVISITCLLAFFGFVFFFIGRKLVKGDRMVQILGILDLLATLSIVGFYVLAIFSFGL